MLLYPNTLLHINLSTDTDRDDLLFAFEEDSQLTQNKTFNLKGFK